jgi:hypothetical protein
VFTAHEQGGTFKAECGALDVMLQELGMAVDPRWLDDLLGSLGADPSTLISFAEFVDVTALALQTGAAQPMGAEQQEMEGLGGEGHAADEQPETEG